MQRDNLPLNIFVIFDWNFQPWCWCPGLDKCFLVWPSKRADPNVSWPIWFSMCNKLCGQFMSLYFVMEVFSEAFMVTTLLSSIEFIVSHNVTAVLNL